MRTVLAWLMVLGLATWSSGCIWNLDDGDDVVCDTDGHWPRCSDQGEWLDCPSGSLKITSCADDSVCMAWQEDGQPKAACVAPDAAPCDPADFEPICAAEDAVWLCAAGGFTYREACEDGQACTVTPVRAACTWPGDMTCDPAQQDPFCDGDAIAYCDADRGIIVQTRDCGPDQTCKLGARGPACAHPDAVACDPQDFVEQCVTLEVGEAVVDCGMIDELTRVSPCDADERCRAAADDARCFGPDQPDCDPDTFENTCQGDDKLVCTQFGVQDVIACPADLPCRVGVAGPQCVEPDAEACDPADFEPTCDGSLKIYCSANGFTYTVDCEPDTVCAPDADPWSWTALTCVDPDSPACDPPGTFTCDGDRVIFCNGGYEVAQDCQPAMVCVADSEFWLCLPEDSTDCDPDVFVDGCADDVAQVCFGQPGKVIEWACADPMVCVDSADGPACQEP